LITPRLSITAHEGDLLHMLDATLRMADGELPHLDFMTPIGILGFAPVAAVLSLGLPVGRATMLADAGMLALMLPAIWWLATTRLSRGQAYYFGAVMVVTMMAVIYGNGSPAISLSMYYNRWGWSLTFLILVAVLFAPKRQLGESWVAPLIIGLSMAALAMLKMTFFVPLLLAVPLVLLVQKQGAALLKAAGVGLVIGLALLGWLGPDFFLAYVDDLLAVMRPESARVNTGVSLTDVIASPKTIMVSIILFAALLLFRKTGREPQGLIVLIMAPAFAYITYQNWGNDHKWLHIIVLYIWANLPDTDEKPALGMPARQVGLALIVAGLTFVFPSIFSLAASPIRAAFEGSSTEFAQLPLKGGVSDIWLPSWRVSDVRVAHAVEGWPTLTPDSEPVIIDGFTFPDCTQYSTAMGQYAGMAAQIEALDFARGRPVLVADVLNALPLMGDIARVQGAAPWYYGDDAGLAGAEFLAVPMCPLKVELRASMLNRVREGGYGLEERYRSELLVLYAVTKPAE